MNRHLVSTQSLKLRGAALLIAAISIGLSACAAPEAQHDASQPGKSSETTQANGSAAGSTNASGQTSDSTSNANTAANANTTSKSGSSADYKTTCSPSAPENFDAFFNHFSENKAFSLERTKLPLLVHQAGQKKAQHLKQADLEKEATLADISKSAALDITQHKTSSSRIEVSANDKSSRKSRVFSFSRQQGCWKLVEEQRPN